MVAYTTKLKTTLVGNTSTGKTSIVLRLLRNEFGVTDSTIGASFFTLDFNDVRYEIWDTAGGERFLGLAPMYYRGSNIVIMVYDLSNLSTIERLRTYFDMVENTLHNVPRIIIVGNKLDLISEKEFLDLKVSIPKKIKSMTRETISDFIYTSAKNGDGMNDLRKALVNNNNNILKQSANKDNHIIELKPIPIIDDKCSC